MRQFSFSANPLKNEIIDRFHETFILMRVFCTRLRLLECLWVECVGADRGPEIPIFLWQIWVFWWHRWAGGIQRFLDREGCWADGTESSLTSQQTQEPPPPPPLVSFPSIDTNLFHSVISLTLSLSLQRTTAPSIVPRPPPPFPPPGPRPNCWPTTPLAH